MLKKIIQRKLQASEFLRHVLILTTGTGIAQIIPLLASPLIGRIYSPEEYGIFALYFSFVSIGATFVTLRYEQLIILVKTSEEALNMAILAFLVTVGILISIFIGTTLIGRDMVLEFIHAQALSPYYHLVFLGIFFSALYQILNYTLNREKKYKQIAAGKIIQTTTLTGLQVSLGMSGMGSTGMIFGHMLGNFAVVGLFFYGFLKNLFSISIISVQLIKQLVGQYKKFPLYNVISDTINVMASNLHVILLLTYFGQEVAGIISFASLFFLAPLAVLSMSFSQVFYQQISQIHRQEDLQSIYRSTLKHLAPIAMLIMAIAYFIPTSLVVFLFGEKWSKITEYLPILAIWFGSQFVGSAVSMIFIKLQKLGILLGLNIINILLTFLSIYLGFIYGLSVYSTVFVFCLSKALVYILVISLGSYIIKRYKWLEGA